MTIARSPLTSDPPFSSTCVEIQLDVFDGDYIPPHSPQLYDPYDDDSFGEEQDDCNDNDDNHNRRVAPHWQSYRYLIESHGYHLDTCKDVRQFFLRYWQTRNIQRNIESCAGYRSTCRDGRDGNELCKDEGLPERLFRGKRLLDDLPIVIKAVHSRSRELDVITALSSPPLRDDPLNHCIPVLEIIHAPSDLPHVFPYAVHRDQLSFIVMEEWSSEFMPPEQSHTLQSYLNSLRCCIQHIAFMHSHSFAHLDIAVRNVLTDYAGRYAYIDYETSGRFPMPPVEIEEGGDTKDSVLIYQPRAAELPPEVESGHSTSPYAMDVWALGTLISKAGAWTGYHVPELRLLTRGMLEPQWERRPSAKMVLNRFETAILRISEERLNSVPHRYSPVVPTN